MSPIVTIVAPLNPDKILPTELNLLKEMFISLKAGSCNRLVVLPGSTSTLCTSKSLIHKVSTSASWCSPRQVNRGKGYRAVNWLNCSAAVWDVDDVHPGPGCGCSQQPPPLVNNSKLLRLGLNDNNLHGSIPNEIGNLQNLKEVILEANNLNGTIPGSIFNISSLQVLSLAFNSLSRTLPPAFGLQLPNLRKLSLVANQLSGSIPSYLSNCYQLTILELNFNKFTGPIPAGLGHLENLLVLLLHVNQLKSQP